MFTRELTVILLPLMMVAALTLLLPLLSEWSFWSEAAQGVILGAALALVLPLCGATARREPFSGLLWVPLTVLVLVLIAQYMLTVGVALPGLNWLRLGDGTVLTTETLFIGYLAVQLLRTRA